MHSFQLPLHQLLTTTHTALTVFSLSPTHIVAFVVRIINCSEFPAFPAAAVVVPHPQLHFVCTLHIEWIINCICCHAGSTDIRFRWRLRAESLLPFNPPSLVHVYTDIETVCGWFRNRRSFTVQSIHPIPPNQTVLGRRLSVAYL